MRINTLISLALLIVTLSVYWQTGTHEFINFDDPGYVTRNRMVQGGITGDSIAQVFSATMEANWHPVTWLSHMVDYQLFGLSASRHHLMNSFLHGANSVLLFLVLNCITGFRWRSAFVAALFALHPLHVESVAWVAERKDLLSTMFLLLTIAAYAGYARRRSVVWYLGAVVLFALGLMAKPMLVTVPFMLLLLDYWPFGRWQASSGNGCHPTGSYQATTAARLVLEKSPFLLLATISSVITYIVQQNAAGKDLILEGATITMRVENALLAYVRYLSKTVWPADLAIIYPFEYFPSRWSVAGAALLMVVVTMLIGSVWRRHPYLAVGWLWFLCTLVPVIGIVKVGSQGMADRYTYIPLIGIFIMIAWGIPELTRGLRLHPYVQPFAAVCVLMILAVCTYNQTGYWKNSVTLYQHAISAGSSTSLLRNNLGSALMEQGKPADAAEQFNAALRIDRNDEMANFNLGLVYWQLGNAGAAIDHYAEAVRIKPGYTKAQANLGIALAGAGRYDEALVHFAAAVELEPGNLALRENLAILKSRMGK